MTFRFNRWVCAALVCAGVGAAYATITKVKELSAVGDGLSENAECDGMAIFNFKHDPELGEATDVNIVITNFKPDTTYGVKYESDFGGADLANAITTNAAGNGHHHDVNIQDATSNPRVIIYVDENGDFEWNSGEERACGGSNCVF